MEYYIEGNSTPLTSRAEAITALERGEMLDVYRDGTTQGFSIWRWLGEYRVQCLDCQLSGYGRHKTIALALAAGSGHLASQAHNTKEGS
ncbi:MAG TPA: hypothetical protein VMW48_02945 [Vicinamibacterales bacterium]|nr:hypothetical protein [Vicinamibacterales bacterium]